MLRALEDTKSVVHRLLSQLHIIGWTRRTSEHCREHLIGDGERFPWA